MPNGKGKKGGKGGGKKKPAKPAPAVDGPLSRRGRPKRNRVVRSSDPMVSVHGDGVVHVSTRRGGPLTERELERVIPAVIEAHRRAPRSRRPPRSDDMEATDAPREEPPRFGALPGLSEAALHAHDAHASSAAPMESVEASAPPRRRSDRVARVEVERKEASDQDRARRTRAHGEVPADEVADPWRADWSGIRQRHTRSLDAAWDAAEESERKQGTTEVIGERNATRYMEENFPGYRLVTGFTSGVGIDQIWAGRDADGHTNYILVEAKGPGAGLGEADGYGGQMSYTWAYHHAQNLAGDRDANASRAGNEIGAAMRGDDEATARVFGIVLQAHARGSGARPINDEWHHVRNADDVETRQLAFPGAMLVNRQGLAVYHRSGYAPGADDEEDL
jgi:hypothetical protein